MGENLLNLPFGQDGGQALGVFGTQSLQWNGDVLVQNFSIEKQERTVSLVLAGCGYLFVHRQMGKKGFDFNGTHLSGMTLLVEEDIPLNPIHVGLLCAIGVVFETESLTNLIKQFWGLGVD